MEMLGPLRRLLTGPDRRRPPAGSPRRRRIRLYGAPLGLVALFGLGLVNVADLVGSRHLPELIAALLTFATLLPVALTAAGRPLIAWRFAYPMMFLGVLGGRLGTDAWPWSTVQILATLVVFTALVFRELSGVIGWATALTVLPVFLFSPPANAWGSATLLIAIALAGDLVSRRRRSRDELAEQAQLTRVEHERRAVLEERTRIAREMHDVVAHHMSMIAVQAETVPYRVSGLPTPAQEEFASIASAARAALTDMRRLLGVLRSDAEQSPREPQPGLADVATLVSTASRAGLVVTLDGGGRLPADVPDAVGLAAYRIVQEALANAARHAPGGPVHVSVRADGFALRVEVRNGPGSAGPAERRTGEGGHGLVGMRERAVLLGGTLHAEAQPGGGYLVAARLPLASEDA
ncbi:sensor histidine kinase [Actinoplanes sp. NPDC049681]|uniref:sensor histidine kinase n=1 Tax=Actinoplanes sp. NPDC049681 TaxID=3363905 RepID=UPI0037A6CF2A